MLDKNLENISTKSSFGMNTDDLTFGISFSSTDVLLPGENIISLDGDSFGRCKEGTGTSFSTALLTGMIADAISAKLNEKDQ